jgi:hypothetical protein
VRLRQMAGAASSAEQAAEQLKVLLDETEREWASLPAVVEVRNSSPNDRPTHSAEPQNNRLASSVETLNGPFKLASGERQILTALAQYPEGRSKVQVAVLTGYAASGGGFNNYLGALRSRGLIEGVGERITITEAGIKALGSWGWGALGVFEMLCAVLLVVPGVAKWMPVLTPLAAAALALESLALALLYAQYSLAIAATNPLVYVVVMALMAAFVACGRYALGPAA